MDWKLAIEEERAALGRIVALLCALAGLAELAGSRSPVVGGFVLWILRHAEAAARDFVAGDRDAPSMPFAPAGSRPAEAIRLAISFRALARQLAGQATLDLAVGGEDGREAEPSPSSPIPAMRDARNALSMAAAFAWRAPHPARAPDTS